MVSYEFKKGMILDVMLILSSLKATEIPPRKSSEFDHCSSGYFVIVFVIDVKMLGLVRQREK